MAFIEIPSGFRTTLDIFGWDKGGWFDFSVLGVHFDVPPWRFHPGELIIAALELVISPINIIHDWVGDVVLWADFGMVDLWNDMAAIWDWIFAAGEWFLTQVWNWWWQTWGPIYDGIVTMIGAAHDLANTAWDWINDFPSHILSFTDPIYAWIGAVIENYMPRIEITDLFAPIQSFMDFIDGVREDITEFFADPWDFLYKKFDDFFERFW